MHLKIITGVKLCYRYIFYYHFEKYIAFLEPTPWLVESEFLMTFTFGNHHSRTFRPRIWSNRLVRALEKTVNFRNWITLKLNLEVCSWVYHSSRRCLLRPYFQYFLGLISNLIMDVCLVTNRFASHSISWHVRLLRPEWLFLHERWKQTHGAQEIGVSYTCRLVWGWKERYLTDRNRTLV